MLAQSLYPHKELIGKKQEALQELCWAKGHNWNDLSSAEKRGTAVYKVPVKKNTAYGEVTRMKFVIDENIPIFSADDCTLFTDFQFRRNNGYLINTGGKYNIQISEDSERIDLMLAETTI